MAMLLDQFFVPNNDQKKDDSFKNDKSSDKPIRSIVKALSWRILGTLDTIIISWVITGQIVMALSIGSVEVITKMILYFFHERIWNIIKWGKK
jgi:uncharacterized membrane protein